MLFGLLTKVGQRNHVLDGGSDLHMQRDNFGGEKGQPRTCPAESTIEATQQGQNQYDADVIWDVLGGVTLASPDEYY